MAAITSTKTPRRCQWTVVFEVSDNWIADQFDLTQECVDKMIQDRLQYAFESEVTARILRKPTNSGMERARKRYDRTVSA